MYIRSKDILEYYRLDETQKDKLRKQQEILIRLLPKELKEMMNEKEVCFSTVVKEPNFFVPVTQPF